METWKARELAMAAKLHVLCVDDEAKVLEGLALGLRRHFRVSTAMNGLAGLAIVEGDDPPAVVVSDMRMPEMDGAVFLGQVKERSPTSVRLLLTGHADIESAMAAVNHGHVFRFLTKPCGAPTFLSAVQAAAEQYRLITAEKVLLEQTLRGSVKALTDVLALARPLAFGLGVRLKQYAADLMDAIGLPLPWEIEVAAMLSQVGCIALPEATHEKIYYGRPLDVEEADRVRRLPELAVQLLGSIPRLEPVHAILLSQSSNFDGTGSPAGVPRGEAIPLGARVLHIVADFATLEASDMAADRVLPTLQSRAGRYDPILLDAFVRHRTEVRPRRLGKIGLAELRPGMVLAEGVVSTEGPILVARGQEATLGLVRRLRNLPSGVVREPIHVLVPVGEAKQP